MLYYPQMLQIVWTEIASKYSSASSTFHVVMQDSLARRFIGEFHGAQRLTSVPSIKTKVAYGSDILALAYRTIETG